MVEFINKFIVDKIRMKNKKRGQITIFVIIGIVIVAAVLIFFFFRSEIGQGLFERVTGEEYDFNNELRNCISNDPGINEKISLIVMQGGSSEPTNYFLFNDTKIEYLCDTNSYYETCYMQRPFVLQHVEDEVEREVLVNVRNCLNDVKESAETRGYEVTTGSVDLEIDFTPGNIVFDLDTSVSVSRAEDRRRYDGFEIRKESDLYELIMLSNSILNFEARYGDTDILSFMTLYPNVKITKLKQSDGTTLYFVESRDSGEIFSFASRSLVWPPGYQEI